MPSTLLSACLLVILSHAAFAIFELAFQEYPVGPEKLPNFVEYPDPYACNAIPQTPSGYIHGIAMRSTFSGTNVNQRTPPDAIAFYNNPDPQTPCTNAQMVIRYAQERDTQQLVELSLHHFTHFRAITPMDPEWKGLLQIWDSAGPGEVMAKQKNGSWKNDENGIEIEDADYRWTDPFHDEIMFEERKKATKNDIEEELEYDETLNEAFKELDEVMTPYPEMHTSPMERMLQMQQERLEDIEAHQERLELPEISRRPGSRVPRPGTWRGPALFESVAPEESREDYWYRMDRQRLWDEIQAEELGLGRDRANQGFERRMGFNRFPGVVHVHNPTLLPLSPMQPAPTNDAPQFEQTSMPS
ncbi:hypothetical protein AA313_de0207383 [Arthrobotrys entomopaga]|nr:hypothetical protein AA313_de0207383 [Arthrobotrys entomopaga]